MPQVTGTSRWFSADSKENEEDTIEGTYIADQELDFTTEPGGKHYRVRLKPSLPGSATWKGTFVTGTNAAQPLAAKVYTSVDGGIALVGEWIDSGYEYFWVADLTH
jgi:hypothetical protein